MEAIAQMGDVVVCPPGLSFHRKVITALSFHFIGFSLSSVSGEITNRGEEDQAIRLHLALSAYQLKIQQPDRLANNMKFLKLPAETLGDLKHYWHNHALNDIWRFCLNTAAAPADMGQYPSDPLIERAQLYIHQNGYGDMSMRKLAAELGIRPVQFSRRFYKCLGVTPSSYLCHMRLEKAKSLLTETHLPLEQIALACGYSNGFYLSRVFTKIMKVSPSIYRKMNRV